MDLRVKSPEEIRRDALSAAGQKLQEGCVPCAERYAALAAQHGATRRDFIKAGGAALSTIVLGGGASLVTGSLRAQPADAAAMWCYLDTWLCIWGRIVDVVVCCWNVWPYMCFDHLEYTNIPC